ncbi:putative germin-like protein 2-1 [Vitis vinifera]|uniref:Germin-like protein n=1 Tax=Vitis vinifera TaxID=29760 RepID=A0A438DTT1_VITVI|nr:putative germin-like protein 2-1 [Vitis vinifera]
MEKSLSTILHVHLNLNPCKISALQMLTARYCIFIDIFLFSACCPGIATVSKTIAFLTFICLLAARVNGLVYKNPMLAQANDFSFSGLHVAGSTSNSSGSRVTPVTVAQLPGLNTLGISTARIDYAPWGINPPHTHPRASEILTVLEVSLMVGFVSSNPENRLFTKVLQKGGVFVFPVGLIHFQRNVGYGNAVALAALSSQNPGAITITNAAFGSNAPIGSKVLAKAVMSHIR